MRELELDGIHDDGMHVVLVDSDGERYALPIDEALRAAVRRDRPALGAVRTGEPAPLRPRDIQIMLRSGRSAEDIAEAHQVAVEHVRRYEGPVIAEREWTAHRARTFPVGRGGPDLATVVSERLTARQASQDVLWDAWRRTDGTWTLELTFAAAGRTRQAHWVADLDARTISPVDDEARWISDENAPPEPVRGRARLMAVKTSVYDVEADGEFDDGAPRIRRGGSPARRSASSSPDRSFSEADLDALNARRGLRSVPPPETESSDAATVWSTLEEEADDDRPASPLSPRWQRRSVDGADEQHAADGARSAGGEADRSVDERREDESAARVSSGEDPSAPSASSASSASPARAALHHQDTVDLTALPGFASADDRASSAPDGADAEDAEAEGSDAERSDADGSDAEGRRARSARAARDDRGDDDEGRAGDGERREPPARKPAKSRSKRASIPSWDEIVFGSKHD